MRWNPHKPGILASSRYDNTIRIETIHCGQYAPSWTGHPVGATFGFGSRLVKFGEGQPGSLVTLGRVVTEPDLVQKAASFQAKLQSMQPYDFCREKAATSKSEERETWNMIRLLFESNSKDHILKYLGHEPKSAVEERGMSQRQVSASKDSFLAAEQDISDADFFEQLSRGASVRRSPERSESKSEVHDDLSTVPTPIDDLPYDEVDTKVKNLLLIGDFDRAVDCLLKANGREADALLMAHLGGESLFASTRQRICATNCKEYMRHLVPAIATADFGTCVADSHPEQWKDTLALILTFSQPGEPLQVAVRQLASHLQHHGLPHAAALCCIAASNIDGAIASWQSGSTPESLSLHDTVEKVFILQQAVNGSTSAAAGALYSEYAGLLAAQGELTTALEFITFASAGTQDASLAELSQRIYTSSGNAPIPVASSTTNDPSRTQVRGSYRSRYGSPSPVGARPRTSIDLSSRPHSQPPPQPSQQPGLGPSIRGRSQVFAVRPGQAAPGSRPSSALRVAPSTPGRPQRRIPSPSLVGRPQPVRSRQMPPPPVSAQPQPHPQPQQRAIQPPVRAHPGGPQRFAQSASMPPSRTAAPFPQPDAHAQPGSPMRSPQPGRVAPPSQPAMRRGPPPPPQQSMGRGPPPQQSMGRGPPPPPQNVGRGPPPPAAAVAAQQGMGRGPPPPMQGGMGMGRGPPAAARQGPMRGGAAPQQMMTRGGPPMQQGTRRGPPGPAQHMVPPQGVVRGPPVAHHGMIRSAPVHAQPSQHVMHRGPPPPERSLQRGMVRGPPAAPQQMMMATPTPTPTPQRVQSMAMPPSSMVAPHRQQSMPVQRGAPAAIQPRAPSPGSLHPVAQRPVASRQPLVLTRRGTAPPPNAPIHQQSTPGPAWHPISQSIHNAVNDLKANLRTAVSCPDVDPISWGDHSFRIIGGTNEIGKD